METKKSLRILAGVFLLAFVLLSVISIISQTYIMRQSLRSGTEWLLVFWRSLLFLLLNILTAVFVLTRSFAGAGAAKSVQALVWLVSIVLLLVSASAMRQSPLYLALSILSIVLSVALNVLLALGFFMRRPSSKGLFITAAILGLVDTAISGVSSYLITGSFTVPVGTVLLIVGFSLFDESFPALAWILLGSYFGAQGREEPLEYYCEPSVY